jgi:two-component system, NtrC family, response regulator AtoC
MSSGLALLILGDGTYTAIPLGDDEQVRIGRGPDVEVVIDHPSVDALHAILHLTPALAIEDQGSHLGTRVRDGWIQAGQPTPIAPGEPIELGGVTLLVQGRPSSTRRVWDHDHFTARIDEECARAERTGSPFAVARIVLGGAASAQQHAARLTALLRGHDVIGSASPRELELLLLDAREEDVERIIARAHAELRPIGEVRIGLACYPRDGQTSGELIGRAAMEARLEGSLSAEISPMRDLDRLVERIARGTISVLILGETGVGKEVFAERIHRRSPRADKPFLRLNCAALTESLLESELFGHERGSFTGADKAKPGLLETAHGGTVFLDEIGELPMTTQVKLLRVIEERQVLRVGGLTARAIDVRFLAATNRDLEAEIGRGAFRQDLFFRLNGFTLELPPLRQRQDEIDGLAREFVRSAARQSDSAVEPRLSAEVLDLFRRYRWPGNIRELRNVIERAVLLCAGDVIGVAHIPYDKMATRLEAHPRPGATRTLPPQGSSTSPEERRILDALAESAGNQTKAARLLGISRRTLINRLDQFQVPRPRK